MSTTSTTTNRQTAATTNNVTLPAAQRGQAAQRGRIGQRGPGSPTAPHPRSGRFAEVLARGEGVGHKHAHASLLPGAAVASTSATTTARDAVQPRAGDDPPDTKLSVARASLDDGDRSLLAPFMPPPSILAAPLCATPSAPLVVSGAPARAEAAALAERLVRSMRIGKVGRDGHEVRLRLDVGARGDVEVRLRHVDGTLSATLVTDAASYVDAERLAVALRRELSERGLVCEDVEVAVA